MTRKSRIQLQREETKLWLTVNISLEKQETQLLEPQSVHQGDGIRSIERKEKDLCPTCHVFVQKHIYIIGGKN